MYRILQEFAYDFKCLSLTDTSLNCGTIQSLYYPDTRIGTDSPPPKELNSATVVTAKEIVLRKCGQIEPLLFSQCYPQSALKNCFKIGEGVYGEVFLLKKQNISVVMKIIPIEGEELVNGERQKKFEEILSEIVISSELSNLRNGAHNQTDTFVNVQALRCVQGCYPSRLVELWEDYDERYTSENDSPDKFSKDQLFVILELGNGGADMESFEFVNASQAVALIKQTACALAVAEAALEFEHRDLHWGNILVSKIDVRDIINFTINGRQVSVPSCGVKVTIIDFTLSRIKCEGVCIYNDLALDPELFSAHGDYQFDIYRLMKNHSNNEWLRFNPFTNTLWLHYMLDKAVRMLKYTRPKSKIHEKNMSQLKQLKEIVLKYGSAINFTESVLI